MCGTENLGELGHLPKLWLLSGKPQHLRGGCASSPLQKAAGNVEALARQHGGRREQQRPGLPSLGTCRAAVGGAPSFPSIVSASRVGSGKETGQRGPNKARLCPAEPSLRTGRSIGYKQPREPRCRGVNKGISEEVSKLGPAGPSWGGARGPFPPLSTAGTSITPAGLGKAEAKCRGRWGGSRAWVSPFIAPIPPALNTCRTGSSHPAPPGSACLSSLANSSGREFLAASSARGQRASPEESGSGGKQPGSAGSKAVSGAGRSTAKC